MEMIPPEHLAVAHEKDLNDSFRALNCASNHIAVKGLAGIGDFLLLGDLFHGIQ